MSRIVNIPESAWRVSRREFFERLGGASAALAAFPPLAQSSSNDEAYWHQVKKQFILRDGLILMNAANLCPSSLAVMEAVFGYLRDEDRDASFQNREKFEELRETSRRKLAQLMGASPDEIALVRNTTEGNNLAVNALELERGDEVLLWDQNHPTNNVAWRVRAARDGFAVRTVSLRWPPESTEEILETFRKSFTPRIKILSFSDVSNVSGTALPAAALCRMAQAHGAVVHIDGAQTFGAKRINLHEIGCDSYAGSAHKWFLGPKEAGLLYVRKEQIERYGPLVVGSGWGDGVAPEPRGAKKFETLGQRNDGTLAAVGKACDFLNNLGMEAVEARTRRLAGALNAGLREIPGTKVYTSMNPALSLGVVIFNLGRAVDHERAYRELYQRYGVGAALHPGEEPHLRLCPHIYNTMDEVEKVLKALREVSARNA